MDHSENLPSNCKAVEKGIEQDISDKKLLAFSEFVVLAVNWATTVTNNEFVSFCF